MDFEASIFRRAIIVELSIMIFDQALGYREAKTGSFTDFFSREEGLHEFFNNGLFYSLARIRHRNDQLLIFDFRANLDPRIL